jgi:hypothetical protein
MPALPHALRGRKISVAIAAALSAIVTLAATLALARPAGALPDPQSSCKFSTLTATPASGYVPLTDPVFVRLNPGDSSVLKAEVTADVGVDSGAEVRLAWSVNSAAPRESFNGPANFANHQQFFETRTTFGLFGISGGVTSVQPFIRVSGPTGTTATLLNRCVTAEASTS